MARRSYSKRNNTKRRPRRQSKTKAPTNKSLNKKIKHIENNLIELKHIDLFNAGTAATVAGVTEFLLPLGQGDTNILRNGNNIVPSSIQAKLQLFSDSLNVATSNIRCIIFWDRQCNGAAPILTGAGGLLDVSVITDPTQAPLNYDSIHRYKVIFDKIYQIVPQVPLTVVAGTTTSVVQIIKQVNIYRKLGRQVKFSGTGATIASVLTNSLNVAYFTDNNTTAPLFQSAFRTYFRDA